MSEQGCGGSACAGDTPEWVQDALRFANLQAMHHRVADLAQALLVQSVRRLTLKGERVEITETGQRTGNRIVDAALDDVDAAIAFQARSDAAWAVSGEEPYWGSPGRGLDVERPDSDGKPPLRAPPPMVLQAPARRPMDGSRSSIGGGGHLSRASRAGVTRGRAWMDVRS